MKQRSFLLCMLTVLSILNVFAYDFESDGIYYTITGSNTVSVVSGDYAYDGDVTIPQAVGLSGKTYLVTAIGENAFKSAANLESVTLPEGLIIIGNEAFRSSGVKTVSLPSTLSSLGASAFRECKNLTGIVLPDALKEIKEYAFNECSNLKTLKLGNQTVTIEQNAFYGSCIEELVLPTSTRTVGRSAFACCSKLKSLKINDAAVFLDGKSFEDCTSLETLDLGNYATFGIYDPGYQQIGTFKGCTALTKVVIPASATELQATFKGCTRLYDVTLPNTLTTIGIHAFEACAIRNITIPTSVKNIGAYSFYGTPLESITLENVISIGQYAFSKCASLKNVEMSSSLVSIDGFAFSSSGIEDITIPSSVTYIGRNALSSCTKLEKVKIQNAPAIMDYGVFSECTNLKTVELGNALGSLGEAAFVRCTSLGSISIPSTISTIEAGTFSGCSNLVNITLPNSIQLIKTGAFESCRRIEHISLPTSIVTIQERAFQYCSSLKELLIPEHVNTIGSRAFHQCTQLETVVFDNSPVTIDIATFSGCEKLKQLDLGEKTVSIGDLAFENCTSLENVVIPNSVQSLGYAFHGCTALKKAVIGTGVRTINGYGYSREGLFSNCSKLSEVEIKSKVLTTIDVCCFYNCRSLKKIELPSSVTSIGGSSFEGCTTLSHIYMNATTPPTIQANSFTDYTTPTLHVPSSAKTAYTKADNWKLFTNIVAIGSEPKATAEEIAALETLLGEAQALYNAAVEGTEPGNYRPGAKAALKAVINEVSARIVENMLKEDVEDCTELLNTAIRSFKNKQVKNEYQTDNTLAFASSLKASRGAEFRLPIEMNNVNEISAVQFDLYLPEGMLLSTDEYGDYQIELGDRTTTRRHSVSSRVMSDGALRVVVSSTQNATFTGNNGTLLSLVLFPQTTMEAGDYDVELKNIVLTDPQATRYAAADMKSVITVSAYTMGDVNNDTHIDVADLTGVVLFILENADASLVFNAADMDGNGVVEVNDYAALVNVILAQNAPAGSRMSGQMEMYPNIISLSDMMVNENGEGELIVNLINKDRSYTGLQFDLYLPEGILLNSETAEAVGRHHGIWAQKHADGYYRVVCSSMMNDELNEGTVMRLQVKAANDMQGTYRVQAGNVVLSDVNAQRHEAANAGAQLMIGDEATGIVSVETAKQLKNVYDIQGRCVNAVKKGVYMVNGKKVVVR